MGCPGPHLWLIKATYSSHNLSVSLLVSALISLLYKDASYAGLKSIPKASFKI